MPADDPNERRIIAALGAHGLWSKVKDRASQTAAARASFNDRFERQVREESPGLTEAEVVLRAEHARKAYYLRLALKSAQARKARNRAAALEAEVEQVLADEVA
jgi:hypothetical protein